MTLLPDITLRIVELIQGGAYRTAELERLVTTDPALCLRILKVVNSAFYGAANPIASIQHAIVVLGADAIKNIALAASLSHVVHKNSLLAALSARDLWRHSLAVAVGAKLVASAAKHPHADEAFLAGLLHDIGFIVQLQSGDAFHTDVVHRLRHAEQEALTVETEIFGATHEQFGRGLCESWGVAEALQDVVDTHHQPLVCREACRSLCCAVHVADVLSQRHELGFGLDIVPAEIDVEVLQELRLGTTATDEIAERLPAMTQEVMQILA